MLDNTVRISSIHLLLFSALSLFFVAAQGKITNDGKCRRRTAIAGAQSDVLPAWIIFENQPVRIE